MARPSIFKQLIVNIIIPVSCVLFILTILYYIFLSSNLTKAYENKNQFITSEIKHIMDFQDLALEIHEEMLEERMLLLSNELVNNYFKNTDNIEKVNLKNIQKQLSMIPGLEDIYIINKEGIVVNTTFRKDFNFDFFSIGEEHKKFLLSIFNSKEFVSERFTIEARTKRLRKYTYQPTNDGKYIVEVGTYSPKADEIVEFIKSHLNYLTEEHKGIKAVDLFILADNPFSLNKDAIIIEDHKEALHEIFKTHDPRTFIVQKGNKKLHYDYKYLNIRNTDLYKGSIIRIITDRSNERKQLQLELIIIAIVSVVLILIIVLLIYIKSREISLPIQNLVENIKTISLGNYEERAKIKGNNEVTELSTQFNRMIDNIQARDIETQQHREKIETQRQELIKINRDLEKLSLVASKTINAISIYDKNGKLEWLNEGFHNLYGYSLNEVLYNIGDNIVKINNNPDIQNLYNICIRTKQSVDFETKTKSKSGGEIWIQTTLSPLIDKKNSVKGVIAIDSNISAIKSVEKKLKERNKDITDSIYYAKKIQEAILPDYNKIDIHFDNLFVLLKPKSIVSGDFFWHTQIDDEIIVAAADCTGHGIPGAFMSIIGDSLLNRIVKDKKYTEPGEILQILRENLHQILNKAQNTPISRDGIDIALCNFNYTTSVLKFAGSFNPLYIVTKGDLNIPRRVLKSKTNYNEYTLYEIKADRFPVGISRSVEKFKTKSIPLKKGDKFYVFTDGFADQFGGPHNKKFKYNNFKNLILQIQDNKINKQKQILSDKFDEWKNKNEQIDDLLIVGVQI